MSDSAMHWLSGLWTQTLFVSAVLAVVLVVRPWFLRGLGAAAMYTLWLAVPMALLALAVPAALFGGDLQPTTLIRLKAAAFEHWQNPLEPMQGLSIPAKRDGSIAAALLLVWALGLVSALAWMLAKHRQLLGQLRWDTDRGHWHSPVGTGPAVIGFWSAHLSLPEDFAQRFSVDEQALILAHEAVHQRRHDNLFNLLASLLCCAHWFNPLFWVALSRWRADQELSCDAQVLRHRGPKALALYANALVKAQNLSPLISRSPSLVCTWQAQHPLIERVSMLNLHRSMSVLRRRSALVFSLCLGLLSAGLVHAISAAAPRERVVPPVVQGRHYIEIDMDLQLNGKRKREVRLTVMRANGRWVSSGKKGEDSADFPWVVHVYATPASDEAFRLEMVVVHLDPTLPKLQIEGLTASGRVVAKPVLLVKAGEKARMEVTDDTTKEVFGVDLTPRWILTELNVLDAVKDRS